MINAVLRKTADKLVRECAAVKSGESVLLLADTESDAQAVNALVQAISDVGAEPIIVTMTPRQRPQQPPPEPIDELQKRVDVLFNVSRYSTGATFGLLQARLEYGLRFITMTNLKSEIMASPGECGLRRAI